MHTALLNLLREWFNDLQKEIPAKNLYLFGSSIYADGRMFNPTISDIDLIIEIPDEISGSINRKNWLVKLKKHKHLLEKRLFTFLGKNNGDEQIVSLVPITSVELKYNIHKGDSRNFFEINEFYNVKSQEKKLGRELFTFSPLKNEFAIQIFKAVQKVRNTFLKNSICKEFNELSWNGNDDVIPKDLARQFAKMASIIESEYEPGDSMNLSFGCDFLKSELKDKRKITEFYNLYSWIDNRSNGRSVIPDSDQLNEVQHLLLYELLFDLLVDEIPSIELRSDTLKIDFTKEHNDFLDDTDMLSKAHESLDRLSLEDIFVNPTFKKTKGLTVEPKVISFDKLLEDFTFENKLIISGQGQSGKTAIGKRLAVTLFNTGFVPIFLSDGKERYLGNLENKLEKAFNSQYYTILDYKDLPKDKIVVLLDDFHLAKNKRKLLTDLFDFKNQILISDDVFGLTLKDEKLINKYLHYKLNEFTPTQRNELILNWVLLSDKQWKTDNEIYRDIDEKTELVDQALGKIIGNGIMPSYPFFILTVLSSYEAGKPLDQNITSQGYLYQVLIYIYLRKQGVKETDIDAYLNFLTELSYRIFKTNKLHLNLLEFEKFIEEYKRNYILTIDVKDLLENLRQVNILSTDDLGNYNFSFPYLYYFFAAKYFSENSNDEKDTIKKIVNNLHNNNNAYIAIFLSNHDKNSVLIDEVMKVADSLFNFIEPAKLDVEELGFFDERIDEVIEAVLPLASHSPEEERKNILELKDSDESSEVHSDNELDEEKGKVLEIRRSVKTVEVIGRIIKNRAESLKKPILTELFAKGMNIHLRLLKSFINLIKDSESQQSIVDIIAERLNYEISELGSERKKTRILEDDVRLKKLATNIFWNLNFNMMYNMHGRVIHSLGSHKLIQIIEEVCKEQDTPATFIIKHGIIMWYSKNLLIDDIYDKIESDGFSKTAKRIIDHRIVNHCQTHRLKHSTYQRISQRSKLPKKQLIKKP